MRARHSKQYNEYQAVQQLPEFIVPGFVRMDPIVVVYTLVFFYFFNGMEMEKEKKKRESNKKSEQIKYRRVVYIV